MGKRQESRDRIERSIVEIGRRHLVTEGAAGLSLRAIARDLGMVSSAVYRYVANRDDLLTLLLVDGYTDLADSVERARPREGPWRTQLTSMAHAARGWALAQPASWALLYGSPVPGYHAPPERTVTPGTRVTAMLLTAVSAGVAAGDIPDEESKVVAPPALSPDLEALRAEFDIAAGNPAVVKCLVLWAALVGAISLEVFGQYGADTFADSAAVFDAQLAALTDILLRN